MQYALLPARTSPLRTGYSVQFFARADRTGDPALGGIDGSRVVQVATRG